MYRCASALAIASLTTACLGGDADPATDLAEPSAIEGEAEQAQALSINANPAALKSANQRVAEAFSSQLSSGVYGARVKRVGGSVSVSLNDEHIFDPASALKVAHYTYSLGTEFASLNAPWALQYPIDPQNPNLLTPCPDNVWLGGTSLVPTSLANGLVLMMQNSDNRVTRAFEDRYTRASLNTMMSNLGMSKSSLNQFIGCGYNNGLRNQTTAKDLTQLYDRVASGSVLQGQARQTFYNLISQGLPNRIAQVINEEGAKLNKTAAFLFDFRNKTRLRWKGGSYNICTGPGCASYEYVRSQAGLLTMPIKPQCNLASKVQFAAATAERQVAYARYITALTIPCTPQGAAEPLVVAENRCPEFQAANDAMNAAEVEMFRSEIRAAIMTFNAPCTPPARPSKPQGSFTFVQTPRSPGIEPDEIDYDGSTRDPAVGIEPDELNADDNARGPTPGIEPDELNADDSTRSPAPGIEPDELNADDSTRSPAPGIEPDEIDYDGNSRSPAPGIEPDEIDYDGSTRSPAPGVEPDEIDYDGSTRSPAPGVEPDEIDAA